jgi:regulator of sigma E protease
MAISYGIKGQFCLRSNVCELGVFMGFLTKVSILVIATITHEFGHLIGAKIVGIKISDASIGFGPTIIKFTRNNINYRISLILLGGYVKPEGTSEDYLKYPKRSRVILTASGLLMSILILPFVCLLLINVVQGTPFNTFIDFYKIVSVLFFHPLSYIFNGINLFPTIKTSNSVYQYLICLGELSFYLGFLNALPIPLLDGGHLLIEILEYRIPNIHHKYTKINFIGYLILILIIATPMLIVFIKNIKVMYPFFILGAFFLYYVLKRYRILFPNNKDK